MAYKTKEQYTKYVQNRRLKFKQEIVDMLGGKCTKCGYNKCLRAMQFHHPDANKDGAVSALISKKGFIKAKEEAKKCELLCANCHIEEHAKS